MLLTHDKAFADFEPVSPQTLRQMAPDLTTSMVANTLVETDRGWCPVEQLQIGDQVQTFDGGSAPVAELRHAELAPGNGALFRIPGGALENCEDLWLPDGQFIMLDSDAGEALFDTPLTLLPVAAFAGFRGIRYARFTQPVSLVDLRFDNEEIIYANTGVMLRCASVTARPEDFFRTLSLVEARVLLTNLDTGVNAPDPMQRLDCRVA